MITENGIVTNANTSTAWIKTIRSGSCESCSSKGSCGTATSGKEMTVTVKNTLSVGKGDAVVIGLETGPVLFLAFLLYVFPIILLIIGAVIGNSIGLSFQINPSLLSMGSGFLFFGLSFYIIRKKNKTLSKNNAYKPFLIRKRSPGFPAGCTPS